MAERKLMARLLCISKNAFPLALVLLGSALLRLINLDYSHFQGDELSALYPIGIAFPDSLTGNGRPGFLFPWPRW
jgi:hypothetical protein